MSCLFEYNCFSLDTSDLGLWERRVALRKESGDDSEGVRFSRLTATPANIFEASCFHAAFPKVLVS